MAFRLIDRDVGSVKYVKSHFDALSLRPVHEHGSSDWS